MGIVAGQRALGRIKSLAADSQRGGVMRRAVAMFAFALAFLPVGCRREEVPGERSTAAPRDWAARRGEVTGAPRLERRQNDAGAPSLAPVPTTPEARGLPPPDLVDKTPRH